MGWRFRRSIRLMPGVRLNFSKSGVSTSIGPRGATVNLGSRGTRATVGLPGTGVSYSALLGKSSKPTSSLGRPLGLTAGGTAMQPQPTAPGGISGLGWVVVSVLAILAIGKCAGTETASAPTSDPPELRYVTASALNCRTSPSPAATAVRSLKQNESVTVGEEANGWSQITGAEPCWVSTAYLSATLPAALGLLSSPVPLSTPTANAMTKSALQSPSSVSAGTRVTRVSKSHRTKSKRTSRNRAHPNASGGGQYFGSGCPCSGNRICIGPRGGRYCITSGGNKRYGV